MQLTIIKLFIDSNVIYMYNYTWVYRKDKTCITTFNIIVIINAGLMLFVNYELRIS